MTKLLYKRVENYNKRSDIDSKIIQLFNKQHNVQEIRQTIATEFEVSFEEAEMKIKDVLYSVDIAGSAENSKIKYIKKILGFLLKLHHIVASI